MVWQGYTEPEEKKEAGNWNFECPVCILVNMCLEPSLTCSLELSTIQNVIWRAQIYRFQLSWRQPPHICIFISSHIKKGHYPYFSTGKWLKRRKSNHFNIVHGFIFLVSGYVITGFLVVSETKILKIKMKHGSNSDKNLVGFWSTWGGSYCWNAVQFL